MIAHFPCLRQPTGQSCLPTTVLAVLHHIGQGTTTLNEVAVWCRTTSSGSCIWDFALAGLGQQFDVDDLGGNWDAIYEELGVNEEPVIVTIAHPLLSVERLGDHAVVLVGVDRVDGVDHVQFMDPMRGTIESKPTTEFFLWWDASGQRAFILRSP